MIVELWWLMGRDEEEEIANDSSSKVKVDNCSVYSSSEEENKVRYGKKMIVGWSRFKIKPNANTVHVLLLVFVWRCFLGKWEGWKFIFHPSTYNRERASSQWQCSVLFPPFFCFNSDESGELDYTLTIIKRQGETSPRTDYYIENSWEWGWIWRTYLLLNAKFRVSRTPFPSILYQLNHKYYISDISTWKKNKFVVFNEERVHGDTISNDRLTFLE